MKRIVSLFLALVMCLSLSVTAFADTADNTSTEGTGVTEPTRWEETEWYYRILDDYYVQRRLWSCTYGYWLTEWETIGHL